MAVLDEIIEDPSLVSQLCELTSSMSLALAVSKLQKQQKEIETLKSKVVRAEKKLDDAIEKLDHVADFVKKNLNSRLTIVENKIS